MAQRVAAHCAAIETALARVLAPVKNPR